MAIQAFNNHNIIANFGFANPAQNLGKLAITMFVMRIISKLPGAEAREAQSVERELCKKLCEPLPGGESDAPEQICTETCEKGGAIVKTKTKEKLQNGAWKTVETIGKVAIPVMEGLDCMSVCSPVTAIGEEGKLLFGAGYKFFTGDKTGALKDVTKAGAKAACTSVLLTPAAYPGCMTCCGGIKLAGIG